MRHQESTFQGDKGIRLYSQSWLPDAKARAVVVVAHGFGEYSGRYGNVVEGLVPRGYAVYAYDLRGHGKSGGPRGLIMSWDEYREDTRAYLQAATKQHPGLPVFLYGHSVGALIALEYAIHSPGDMRGVVATGPTLGPPGVSPFLLALSRVLSVVAPRFTLKAGVDAEALSRNPQVCQAYRDDPLVHGRASARLGGELQRVSRWVQDHAADLRVPLLLVHGEADRLSPPAYSHQFFPKAGATDKTFLEQPGGFHEPHNDIEHARVMADIAAWLDRHV